jgi:2-succinyl-5-enolpyruvyl-6-hydroxy-3-cyclohexene-1-carboxylate synthase
MISSNKIGVRILVEQCVSHGMKNVVCSPGSRNAPIVIALDEHPDVTCFVVHDERSAAFFALGMSQQLNEPVGIICTSGSAALNYFPAIAEAFYQCVPLVVITADRPEEWINQGDGQTIVQKNVFGEHVRYACQFSEKINSEDQKWYLEREISIAFSEGNTVWKGPIHFNISLQEPLYGTEEYEPEKSRKIEIVRGTFHLTSSNRIVCEKALQLERKMIICGQMDSNPTLLAQLKIFAEDTSVVVLVENTSNLVDMQFIHCIDRTLNSISELELENYAPDLLITIGGAVVSKKIKAFIRKQKPKLHWKVGFEFPYMDTYQCLSHSFLAQPEIFFSELNSLKYDKNCSNYGSKWKQLDFTIQDKLPAFFEKVAHSDIKVFETILDYLPEMSHLHMANSSVVRYCQLFDPIKSIKYWSNRGTSGIDGSSSTACGAAVIKKEDFHILISGDISFLYDSNAFWNQYLTPNLRVILINNGGGGIFKIIPGPASSKQLEKYFEAQHNYDAKHISEAFGLVYYQANSMEQVESQMEEFYQYDANGRPKLLEIHTKGDLNPEKLEDFFNAMK